MDLWFADSVDSYGAMVLLNLGRLTEVSSADYKKYKTLANNALAAIQLCQVRLQGESTKDKLTVATPLYRIKYLLDNVEVLQGLKGAQKYYTAIGDATSANTVAGMITKNTSDLSRFYSTSLKRFVYVVDMQEAQQSRSELRYDGLANLYALGHITGFPNRSTAWSYANTFPRDAGDVKDVPTGRWLMAAYPFGRSAETKEYNPLLKEIDGITQLNNRVQYPGTALVAIYGYFDAKKRLPSIPYTAFSNKSASSSSPNNG